MKSFSERLAWVIGTIGDDSDLGQGIGMVELAKKLKVDYKTLSRYKKGEGTLKGESLDVITSEYKINPMWLMKGQGEPFPGARDKYPNVCGPEESLFIIETTTDEKTSEFKDYVFIPRVNDQISAGPGTTPYNMSDLRIAFRKDWIRRKGDPKNMSLIKVIGDSMEPTLLAGDLVLIDHNRNRIDAQGGIYALSIDHEIMIKRIHPQYPHGKIKIISDNPRYEPIVSEVNQIKINGKVIWFAREIER